MQTTGDDLIEDIKGIKVGGNLKNIFFKWQKILNNNIFSSDRKISNYNSISYKETGNTKGSNDIWTRLLIMYVGDKGERLAEECCQQP